MIANNSQPIWRFSKNNLEQTLFSIAYRVEGFFTGATLGEQLGREISHAKVPTPRWGQGKAQRGTMTAQTAERTARMLQTDILTVEQVTELYGISRSTVYAWVQQNRITYYKPSPKILLFRKSEIEDYLLSNRTPSKAEIEAEADTEVLLSAGERKWKA